MQELNNYLEESSKHIYYSELERKEKIYSSLNLPAGVISLLFGVAIYYAQNIVLTNLNSYKILFLTFSILFLISLIVSVYFLLKVLYKYTYSYLPTPITLENYTSELKNYYSMIYNDKSAKVDLDECVKTDLQEYFIDTYTQCNEINIANNDRKVLYRYRCHVSIIISLVFLAVSFFPYYIIRSSDPVVQKIEIINSVQGENNDKEKKSSIRQTNSTEAATTRETKTTESKTGN